MASDVVADVIEAGAGPLVVLVHSSVAGARQWRKLIDGLAPTYRVVAPNLYGYGATPPWSSTRRLSLDDLADIVEGAIPAEATDVRLVGHSLGATVAMQVSRRLGSRASKLLLIEPNTFPLLREAGRREAYDELLALRDVVRSGAATGSWTRAAEIFADYWSGPGTWAAMTPERRAAFAGSLAPNLHEWDAILDNATPLAEWAAMLPARTHVLHDPATVRPVREIVELMQAGTPWRFATFAEGGHMAPLTRPDLINPMIVQFLVEV
jgi:pimeloyl-ACP methyl ester carboxylesterase